ncbi:MAG TPA: AtpZ/AtpI family protein [Candidatus Obscuribacter sp.]|nr:AtpZ/AtpI family protein [Candidatus Obscuribacter sp.]HMW92069.1 AtpZ/AtpI family protein [Candidatus Obscuribacter sp.]HMY01803.1 AtpZ/AtpI family protein [Candidatus Obscuribacter sp.]HMY52271.1 AtpZ/AtpI family protein [Candidatus Obscuribacter sp.]HNB14589.1 AtpZ/AtpI family protein [Candidatus Obscuribacter sp.]
MKNESSKNDRSEGGSLGAQIMMASEMGAAIVFLSLAGYLGGDQLDSRLNCAPWGVVGGILLGLTLGLAFVVKRSNDMDRQSRLDKERRQKEAESSES